jgi:hypothetical protein
MAKEWIEKLGKKLPDSENLLININLLDKRGYPFCFETETLKALSLFLIENYSKKITLIFPEFRNSRWGGWLNSNAEWVRKSGIKIIQANLEERKEYEVGKEVARRNVYVPLSWANAESRLNLATVRIHSHHSRRYLYGALVQQSLLFTRKDKDLSSLTLQEYLSLMEIDFQNYIDDSTELCRELPSLTVLDAQEVVYSDEHSPRVEVEDRVKEKDIFVSDDPVEVDLEILKRLGERCSYKFKRR